MRPQLRLWSYFASFTLWQGKRQILLWSSHDLNRPKDATKEMISLHRCRSEAREGFWWWLLALCADTITDKGNENRICLLCVSLGSLFIFVALSALCGV